MQNKGKKRQNDKRIYLLTNFVDFRKLKFCESMSFVSLLNQYEAKKKCFFFEWIWYMISCGKLFRIFNGLIFFVCILSVQLITKCICIMNRVFFSFSYQNDVYKSNEVKNKEYCIKKSMMFFCLIYLLVTYQHRCE